MIASQLFNGGAPPSIFVSRRGRPSVPTRSGSTVIALSVECPFPVHARESF